MAGCGLSGLLFFAMVFYIRPCRNPAASRKAANALFCAGVKACFWRKSAGDDASDRRGCGAAWLAVRAIGVGAFLAAVKDGERLLVTDHVGSD